MQATHQMPGLRCSTMTYISENCTCGDAREALLTACMSTTFVAFCFSAIDIHCTAFLQGSGTQRDPFLASGRLATRCSCGAAACSSQAPAPDTPPGHDRQRVTSPPPFSGLRPPSAQPGGRALLYCFRSASLVAAMWRQRCLLVLSNHRRSMFQSRNGLGACHSQRIASCPLIKHTRCSKAMHATARARPLTCLCLSQSHQWSIAGAVAIGAHHHLVSTHRPSWQLQGERGFLC